MPVVLLLILIYTFDSYCDMSIYGIYIGCSPLNYMLYNFIHTNMLHLLINAFFLVFYWEKIKTVGLWYVFPIIGVVPICAGLMATYDTPTVGSSAVVMSMVGILAAYIPRIYTVRLILTLVASSVITLLFAPHINTMIHLYSFVLSYFLSLIIKYVRR